MEAFRNCGENFSAGLGRFYKICRNKIFGKASEKFFSEHTRKYLERIFLSFFWGGGGKDGVHVAFYTNYLINFVNKILYLSVAVIVERMSNNFTLIAWKRKIQQSMP